MGLAAAALCLALPGQASDQTPADEPGGAAASLEDMLPVELRDPALDPFAGATALRAHRLRGLTAEVVGLILGGSPGGDIAFEALATPLSATGGKAMTPLFIEIDGSSFLESNQSRTARVEVYAYALGADDDQVAAFLAEAFAVDVQDLGEAIWQSGLKFFGHLDVAPGKYRLRVLVRNYQSGASGRRELTLEVPPSAARARPFVLSPLFPPPPSRDAWLPVRESSAPADYPFVTGERALSPAVRPVLLSGRPCAAHLFAYGLPAGAPKGRVELLRGGDVVAGAALEIASREPSGGAGPEALAITFDTPRADPGVYSLRVELAGGAQSQPATVVVLQQGASDRGLLWTDLRGSLGGTADAATRPAAAPPGAAGTMKKKLGRAERKVLQAAKLEEEQRIRRLADSYREALLAMGRGEESAAHDALLDLESSVLADGSMRALQSAQLAVAEQLAAGDVESLVPLLVLHDDAYQIYRQRRLYSLGFNARVLIETLAEIYAERGGTQGSAVVAARALASLGGRLQEANLPASSRQLYERALAHDPANRAALLGLATSFERYGEYPPAVAMLERLVAAHPAFAEGQVRLALNLDRLGLRGRCRELLARALELEAPDWVRSLAYQGLARIDLETGDLEGAAQLLETSLAAIPDQHGTVYLLAHVYDRRRQAYKALELLQTATPAAAGSRNESERKRYDSWPEETLAATRRALAEAARVRLHLVIDVLQGAAGS